MSPELRARAAYAAVAIATIVAGLAVHLGGLPLSPAVRDVAGDALWAAMLTWWISALVPRMALGARAAVALAVCVAVEASQLYHAPALDAVRATGLGHLVLGSGFDPRDFAAYALGVLGAAALERAWRGRTTAARCLTRHLRTTSHPTIAMPDLQTALQANHEAVQAFLASARALPPDRWDRPRAEGKWSPGQIVEHLALAYETGGEVLHGRSPGKAPPRFLRPLIRTLLLKPVLWLGRFPTASKAPSVMRPGTSPGPAPVLLDRFETAVAAFESAARNLRSPTVDHPAFGRLPVVDLVRLQEIHTRHHHLQLPYDAA